MAIQVNTNFTKHMGEHIFDNRLDNPVVNIYKGTVPVIGDIANWSTYATTRASDLLATLPDATNEDGDTVIRFQSGSPTPTNASATGTATWAAWVMDDDAFYAIVGDVAAIGGTGLFILDSVNLTVGNLVTLVGFRLSW